MGYPMTWRRFINRNGLQTGDYSEAPSSLMVQHNLRGLAEIDASADFPHADHEIDPKEWYRTQMLQSAEAVDRLNGKVCMFMGDLRRLEADTIDESATCQHIASRTGIDPEVVAAVLKEFMAW